MSNKIDKLIINSPYQEPTHYWSYKREIREFILKEVHRTLFIKKSPKYLY